MGTGSKGSSRGIERPARKKSGAATLKAGWQKAFVGPGSEERKKEAKLLIDAVRSNPAIANVGNIKGAVDDLEKLMTTYASKKLPVNLMKPHLQTLKEALVKEASAKNEKAIIGARRSIDTFCGQITPENLRSSLNSLTIVWVRKNAPDNMKGFDVIENSWKDKIDKAKQSKPPKTNRWPGQKKGSYCARRALKAFGEISGDECFAFPPDRDLKKEIATASPGASPSEVAGEFFLHRLMEESVMIRSHLEKEIDKFLEKANATDDFPTPDQISSFQNDCKSLIQKYEATLHGIVGLAAKLMNANAEALSKHLRKEEREELRGYGKALLKEFLPQLLSHDRMIGKVYLWAKCCVIDPLAGLQAVQGLNGNVKSDGNELIELNGDVKSDDNELIEFSRSDEFESEEIEVRDVSIPKMGGQQKIPLGELESEEIEVRDVSIPKMGGQQKIPRDELESEEIEASEDLVDYVLADLLAVVPPATEYTSMSALTRSSEVGRVDFPAFHFSNSNDEIRARPSNAAIHVFTNSVDDESELEVYSPSKWKIVNGEQVLYEDLSQRHIDLLSQEQLEQQEQKRFSRESHQVNVIEPITKKPRGRVMAGLKSIGKRLGFLDEKRVAVPLIQRRAEPLAPKVP